jgi:hypothetical protein
MTTRAHDRSELAAFLYGETRQVWARNKLTGDPVFIEEGTAGAVRETARRDWACIVPGCEASISTRGGSKRDHFFHLGDFSHPGGLETLNHLAAKAMLAQWAMAQVGGQGVVHEEQTIKNGLDLYRRPDVLATWCDGRRVALEVEYKSFSEQDWAAKQRDLDREGVRCSWLLGHTKITAADPDTDTRMVRVPLLGRALAESGHYVFVVNPITRRIGTLAGDSDLEYRWRGDWSRAWLSLDDLADCELDTDRGIVTPTMRRIDDAETARVRVREQRAREEQRREAAARESADRWARISQANLAAWETSTLRTTLEHRWHRIPDVLAKDGPSPYGIHALPVHWHAVVYEALVQTRGPGYRFGPDDCWKALSDARIKTNWTASVRYRSLVPFLEALTREDVLERMSKYRWKVIATLDDVAERAEREAHTRREHTERERRQRSERERAEQAKRRAEEAAEATRREQLIAERRQYGRDQEAAWQASELRSRLLARYGDIPRCIVWPNTLGTEVIAVAPAQWRAVICAGLVEDAPAGTDITLDDVKALMHACGIPFAGADEDVDQVIAEYLENLRQRGILQPGSDGFRFVLTGAGLA